MIRPALMCLMLASPAAAQSIAFAQAPEQSFGVGTGDTLEAAVAAARADCVAGGALEEDCLVTACDNAGWSVDFFVQQQEGPHWHEVFCGFSDRAVAEAVEAVICDSEARPYLLECALVQVYDFEGTPQMEW